MIKEGKGIDAQTLTLDFAVSFLEICEARPLPKTQGNSRKKLVSQGAPDWIISGYSHEGQVSFTLDVRALRTDGWKDMRYLRGDGSADKHRAGMYSLKQDAEERNNLNEDPNCVDPVKEISGLLFE